MAKKTIKLTTQEDLKVFMSPQRQKLLRHMRMAGEAVTSKAVADMLEISTSSAQFHIRKLEKLDIVELDHTEKINGILAKFYKIGNINVSIGSNISDDLSNERYITMQNLIKGTFDGLIEFYELGESNEEMANHSEFINGFINLTHDDSQELLRMIREFIEIHENEGEGTQIWEYQLMMYNTGVKKIKEKERSDNN
jgi:hypothetical protein